jgi:hypothetical protein
MTAIMSACSNAGANSSSSVGSSPTSGLRATAYGVWLRYIPTTSFLAAPEPHTTDCEPIDRNLLGTATTRQSVGWPQEDKHESR